MALQKPWTCAKDSRWLLKTHPSFRLYAITDAKPRCATYISRALTSSSISPPRPYWTDVKVCSKVVTNVYLPPTERSVAEEFLARLSRPRWLVVGDFNAKYPSWGAGTYADPRGRRVADWAAERGLRPALRNEATYDQGGTLDLIFQG